MRFFACVGEPLGHILVHAHVFCILPRTRRHPQHSPLRTSLHQPWALTSQKHYTHTHRLHDSPESTISEAVERQQQVHNVRHSSGVLHRRIESGWCGLETRVSQHDVNLLMSIQQAACEFVVAGNALAEKWAKTERSGL